MKRLVILVVTVLFSVPAAAQESAESWYETGQHSLEQALKMRPNRRRARNVILFVGDGMGVSTVTAARILEGQQRGEPGEENFLSFERFPYVALSKTFNTNQQVGDSAGTMSAMMTGIKTRAGVISVQPKAHRSTCDEGLKAVQPTLLELAEDAGLATGVVTTARLTHATPAACYAHVPERNWEDDSKMPDEAKKQGCTDIAAQLIGFHRGDGLELAWGGGRRGFLPATADDPEDEGKTGNRTDGRDLTAEWEKKYGKGTFIWNEKQFEALDASTANHVLALFERSHMEFEHDRPTDTGGEPSLSEMTAKAIDILSKRGGKNGFFLMVEAGRIDHGHHAGNAYRALTDAIELSRAVSVATRKTSERDTLIIVTADHSHTLTMAGYPARGNPILGKVVSTDEHGNTADGPALDPLGLPYTTLNYANGPGYVGKTDAQPAGPKTFPHFASKYEPVEGRVDLTEVDTTAPDYLQDTYIPSPSETHGGEDVAIYARGPGAYLFHGAQEQNYIFHVMHHALRLDRRTARKN